MAVDRFDEGTQFSALTIELPVAVVHLREQVGRMVGEATELRQVPSAPPPRMRCRLRLVLPSQLEAGVARVSPSAVGGLPWARVGCRGFAVGPVGGTALA